MRGSCDSAFGDQHPSAHSAGKLVDGSVLLVEQRQLLQNVLDKGRIRRPAEKTTRKADCSKHLFERFERDFLRHQADQGARAAVILHDIVAANGDAAASRRDNAANDRNQGGLSGAVRAEKGQDLAFLDVERHVFQRLVAAFIGLRQVF